MVSLMLGKVCQIVAEQLFDLVFHSEQSGTNTSAQLIRSVRKCFNTSVDLYGMSKSFLTDIVLTWSDLTLIAHVKDSLPKTLALDNPQRPLGWIGCIFCRTWKDGPLKSIFCRSEVNHGNCKTNPNQVTFCPFHRIFVGISMPVSWVLPWDEKVSPEEWCWVFGSSRMDIS